MPAPPASQRSAPASSTVGIRAVTTAPYLNRPQIVVRQGERKVEHVELDRWAEPLDGMIGTCLADVIAAEMPSADVVTFPWTSGRSPDIEIAVAILRLDGQPGGTVDLRADWQIISAGRERRVLYQSRTILQRECTGQGIEGVVAATESLLADLSKAIASSVTSLRSTE